MIGRAVIAAFLILVGVTLVLLAVIALIDPVGSKLADDADPFGPPVSRWSSAITLLAGCANLGVGGLVIRSAIRRLRARGPTPCGEVIRQEKRSRMTS